MPEFDTDTGRILFLGGLAVMVVLLVLSAPAARALRGTVGIRRAGLLLYASAALPMGAGGLIIGGVLPEGMWVVWLMLAGLMAWGLSLVVFSAVAFLRGGQAAEPSTADAPLDVSAESRVAAAPVEKAPRARELPDNPALPDTDVKIRCAACGKKMRALGPKFAKQRRCPNCKASPFRFVLEEADGAPEPSSAGAGQPIANQEPAL